MSAQPPLKPMSLPVSLLYFGIPAVVLILFIYGLNPIFLQAGLSPIMSHMLSALIPLVLMFVASLVALRMEGYPVNMASLRDRFRVRRMTGRDWLWTVGFTLVAFIVYGLMLQFVEVPLVRSGVIPLPSFVPKVIDPRLPADISGVKTLFGGQIVGNWLVVIVNVILLFFNIFGEEFWWRGLILPRQELAWGRWAWVWHGVLWTLFHAFKYWDYIALLPVTLALAYVVQRRQNTTVGIIMHAFINGFSILSLIPLVAGLIPIP
jgi:membrane protease YdiL (CAAX protease family)